MDNILVRSYSVVRDLTSPIDRIEAVTAFQLPIGERVMLRGAWYVCNGSYASGATYTNTLYSEPQMRSINTEINPIRHTGDVKSLLSNVGVPHNITDATNYTEWMLSVGGISGLLGELGLLSSVVEGGAPFFNLTINGNVVMTDIKRIYDNVPTKPVELPYKVESDSLDTGWTYNFPCVLNATRQVIDGNQVTERIRLGRIGTSANMVIDDRTGFDYANAVQRYRNEYNRLLYRSRRISFRDVHHACKVGDVVNVQGLVAVVDFVECPIPIGDEIQPQTVRAVMPYTM